MKGHAGAFNPQVRDLIEILVPLVQEKAELESSFVKALNMF